MTKRPEMDPIEELRRADPVDSDRLTLAALARIRERTQGVIMDQTERPSQARRGLRWPQALVAGIGGVAVAALAVVVLNGSGSGAPGGSGGPRVLPDPDPSGGPISASCVETYSLDTLSNRDFAFDGTVTGISGDSVTFTVNEAYRGSGSASVTLTATGMTGTSITSVGGPNLAEGERYLIAGDGEFVWGCGFSQPYQADIAAQWATAFDG